MSQVSGCSSLLFFKRVGLACYLAKVSHLFVAGPAGVSLLAGQSLHRENSDWGRIVSYVITDPSSHSLPDAPHVVRPDSVSALGKICLLEEERVACAKSPSILLCPGCGKPAVLLQCMSAVKCNSLHPDLLRSVGKMLRANSQSIPRRFTILVDLHSSKSVSWFPRIPA